MYSVSKQHAVIPSQVFELEDGSSSYKDFAMTRNNRFSSAGQASKNIIQPPSAVLHYYNVPPCISQDHLLRVCYFCLINVLFQLDFNFKYENTSFQDACLYPSICLTRVSELTFLRLYCTVFACSLDTSVYEEADEDVFANLVLNA